MQLSSISFAVSLCGQVGHGITQPRRDPAPRVQTTTPASPLTQLSCPHILQKSVTNFTTLRAKWSIQDALAARSSPQNTLEQLYQDCSWGKAFFTKDRNIIVDLQDQTTPDSITSQIPCSGTTVTCSGLSVPLQGGACASLRQQWLSWAIETTRKVSKPAMAVCKVSFGASHGLALRCSVKNQLPLKPRKTCCLQMCVLSCQSRPCRCMASTLPSTAAR